MANRVCLGQRATNEWGLWVSKPGINVLTGTDDQMLFASDLSAFQIMASGALVAPTSGSSVGLTIANFGFRPVVLWACLPDTVIYTAAQSTIGQLVASVTYNSNTSITFNLGGSSRPAGQTIYYAVINVVLV